MKIVCTAAEKEWLIHLMAESESCPIKAKCNVPCPECLQKSIEWAIIEDEKHTCGECAHYIGGENWSICCEQPIPGFPFGRLCYEWTEACDKFKRKGD